MDLELLSELDTKKAEEAAKISKNYKKDEVDILDFYPHLNLNTPYSGTNSTNSNSIKPYQLLPFFNTVIVDIVPLPNEKLFKKYYGTSIEELIELERKEKVAIRLPTLYTHYKDVENDYLDPILSRRPASSFLINLCYGNLVNGKFIEELAQTENFFKNKEFDFGNNLTMEMGIIDPLVLASSDIITGQQPYLSNLNNDDYSKFTQNNFVKLYCTGYDDIIEFLKGLLSIGHGRLDWAFTYSSIYASFLADPILSSLNGTHMVNYNMKEILNDLIIRNSNKIFNKELQTKSNDILSYDIGKTLSKEIFTPLPLNLEESLDFDYEGAINALKSLEKVVDEKNRNEIIDLTQELSNEIQEAGQIASNMRGSVNKNLTDVANITTTIGLLGVTAGQLVEDPNIKPLLTSISAISSAAGLFTKTETLQKALEKVIKYNKNDHVLYLYNNFEKFSVNPKEDKLKILKSKKIFKDDLAKEYEYYEYIYKNIPIMRVIIDMTSRLVIGEGPMLKYTGNDKVPNIKVKEELEEWFKETLSNETLRLQNKQTLVYGKSYYSSHVVNKGRKKTIKLKLINPKFIRPYKKGYKVINEKGKEELFKKDEIIEFYDPAKNNSFIEKYIYLLDELYPEITKKGNRPKLLYDLLFENIDKAWRLDDLKKSKNFFLEAFNISVKLENWVWMVTILAALGDLHRKYNNNIEALEYYEKAQDYIEGKVYSVVMEKLEKDLIYKILETQKLV